MNKVEISGTIYNEVRTYGTDKPESRRTIFVVVASDDDNPEQKTFLPCIGWREVSDKLTNLKKDEPIHFIGKVRRHKNKSTNQYETDVEIKELL